MKFHHICLVVHDTDRAIEFWRDIMGFTLTADFLLPDGDEPGPDTIIDPKLCDDIFGEKRLAYAGYAPNSPWRRIDRTAKSLAWNAEPTPPANLRYRHTGMHELAFEITSIDAWFDKIRAAGFKPTTDYVWNAVTGRTFLFPDPEGNLIQLWESPDGTPKWPAVEAG